MIAKSDLVILIVSTTLLGAGIYRWQNNMARINAAQSIAASPRPAAQSSAVSAAGASQTSGRQNVNAAASATANNAASRIIVNAEGTPGSGQSQRLAADAPLGDSANTVVGNVAAVDSRSASDQGTTQTGTILRAAGPQANEPLYGSYIVQPGDYLGKIAETYGTTVATLQSINGIEGSLIEVDQVIRYPLPAN